MLEEPGKEHLTLSNRAAGAVADRWHLIQNLRIVLEKVLTGCYQRLRNLSPLQSPVATHRIKSLPFNLHIYSQNELTAKDASRKQRLLLYRKIKGLQARGYSIRQMSQLLNVTRSTIRHFALAESFPDRARYPARLSMLAPFQDYLEKRYQEGCRNAQQLWREICQQGYQGSDNQPTRWLFLRRSQEQEDESLTISLIRDPMSLPSPKTLALLMVKSASWLDESEQQAIKRICQDSLIAQVYSLAETFTRMIRQQDVNLLDDWLSSCRHCPSKLLQQFGRKVEYDYQAVRAAMTSEWSNGQTEGQVNRLKLLKRQMYGRAKLDLLRQRILYRYNDTQIA